MIDWGKWVLVLGAFAFYAAEEVAAMHPPVYMTITRVPYSSQSTRFRLQLKAHQCAPPLSLTARRAEGGRDHPRNIKVPAC